MKKKWLIRGIIVIVFIVVAYIGLCSRCYYYTESDTFIGGLKIYGRNTIKKGASNYLFLKKDPGGSQNTNWTEELKKHKIIPEGASQVTYWGDKTKFIVEGDGPGLELLDPMEGNDYYNSLTLYGKKGRAVFEIVERARKAGDELTLKVSAESTVLVRYEWLGIPWTVRLKMPEELCEQQLMIVEED